MGLTLLAIASMPLKYWYDDFLATTYLINRTPIKLLNFDTPIHCLLNDTPEYSSLPTFGCACWPNLRPYNSKKLQFRSTLCAFLGYSNMHKRFKCLNISTSRIYISRDVVFNESTFPFTELNPTAYAHYSSKVLLLPSSSSSGNDTQLSLPNMHSVANNVPIVVFPPTQVRPQMIQPVESASNATRANPGAQSGTRSNADLGPAPGLGAVSLPDPDSEAVQWPPRVIITPVTPRITASLITFIKFLIKNQIHWLIQR
jgi:hypothetical protein